MKKQLGINPEMDALARDNGLGHWSCVSPLDCGLWVRSDGCHYANGVFIDTKNDCVFRVTDLFAFPVLRVCDEKHPIGKDWQQLNPFRDLENAIFNPAETLEYLEITDLSLENLRRIKGLITGKLPKDTAQQDKLLKISLGALNQFADDNDSTRAIKLDIERHFDPRIAEEPDNYDFREDEYQL